MSAESTVSLSNCLPNLKGLCICKLVKLSEAGDWVVLEGFYCFFFLGRKTYRAIEKLNEWMSRKWNWRKTVCRKSISEKVENSCHMAGSIQSFFWSNFLILLNHDCVSPISDLAKIPYQIKPYTSTSVSHWSTTLTLIRSLVDWSAATAVVPIESPTMIAVQQQMNLKWAK